MKGLVFNLAVAENGRIALKQLERESFDVVQPIQSAELYTAVETAGEYKRGEAVS